MILLFNAIQVSVLRSNSSHKTVWFDIDEFNVDCVEEILEFSERKRLNGVMVLVETNDKLHLHGRVTGPAKTLEILRRRLKWFHGKRNNQMRFDIDYNSRRFVGDYNKNGNPKGYEGRRFSTSWYDASSRGWYYLLHQNKKIETWYIGRFKILKLYAVGQLVYHEKYGVGHITAMTPKCDGVSVKFDSKKKIRHFIIAKAPLVVLGMSVIHRTRGEGVVAKITEDGPAVQFEGEDRKRVCKMKNLTKA